MTTSEMTNTSGDDIMIAVKSALREVVRPWEILCGFTDIGTAYVPDIYCKKPEDFKEHEDLYMDADTPLIDKASGEVFYKEWDDPNVRDALREGNYIKIQDKPKYAQE